MTTTEYLVGEAIAFVQLDELQASAGQTGEGLYVLAQRDSPADWYRDCMRSIDELCHLPENWDSYGANSVDQTSIDVSKQLVLWLAQFTGIEHPRIASSPAGHVSLSWEWDSGSRELDVEIVPDGTLQFSFLDEVNPDNDIEDETTDPHQIVRLLTQW